MCCNTDAKSREEKGEFNGPSWCLEGGSKWLIMKFTLLWISVVGTGRRINNEDIWIKSDQGRVENRKN